MTNFVEARKTGRFLVPDECIYHYPHTLKDFLKNYIVVRAEYLFAHKGVEYNVYSPVLPSVPKGEVMPDYVFIFRPDQCLELKNGDGVLDTVPIHPDDME